MVDPTYGPDGTFNNWKGLSFIDPAIGDLGVSKLQDRTQSQWPSEMSWNLLKTSEQSHVVTKAPEVGSMGLGHRY